MRRPSYDEYQHHHPVAKVVIDDGDRVYAHPRAPSTPAPGEKRYKGLSGRLCVDALAATAILLAVLFGLLAGVGVFDKNTAREDAERPAPPTTPVSAPVVAPVTAPVSVLVPPTADCTLATLDINGDGVVLVRQFVDLSAQTVTVQMEYAGDAWLGFAFSKQAKMTPNVAAIGLPDAQTVLRYNLVSKGLEDKIPLEDDQTLTDASIVQQDGTTILTFTQNIVVNGETVVNLDGLTRFNWAVGNDNGLGFHSPVLRGSNELAFVTCGEAPEETLAPDETEAPKDETSPPTASPVSQIVPPTDELDCSYLGALNLTEDGSLAMRQIINPVEQTVSVELEYFGIGWLGFAFSETDRMIPNIAVVGLPDDDSVRKYNLTGKSPDAVIPLSNDLQTLEASIEQTETSTILKFTRKLVETNESTVKVGENRFNWAYGSSNSLGYHKGKGSIVAVFDECRIVRPPVDETLEPADTEAPSWSPIGADATGSPAYSPTIYLQATAPPSWFPTAWPTDRPTYLRTGKPTYVPTYAPTYSPVVPPTLAPTYKVTENPTWSPTAPYNETPPAGTWSKRGNRRACSRTVCPSAPWTGGQYADNGSICHNGKDASYWEVADPVTYEYFTDVTMAPTDTDGLWKLEATGKDLALGWGGDFASEGDCFDDTLRGGFRIDLSGDPHGFVLAATASITVTGWAPVLRVTADGVLVDEWRGVSGQAGEHVTWVPYGTQVLQVECGGWPAECASDLWVTKQPVADAPPTSPGYSY